MELIKTIPALQYAYPVYEPLETVTEGKKKHVIEKKIVTEIFIPSLQMIINTRGDLFPALAPLNYRKRIDKEDKIYPLTELQIPLEQVERIGQAAKTKFGW